jgi:hypothetical protein
LGVPFFQAFLQSQSKKVGLHFQSFFAKKDFQFRVKVNISGWEKLQKSEKAIRVRQET